MKTNQTIFILLLSLLLGFGVSLSAQEDPGSDPEAQGAGEEEVDMTPEQLVAALKALEDKIGALSVDTVRFHSKITSLTARLLSLQGTLRTATELQSTAQRFNLPTVAQQAARLRADAEERRAVIQKELKDLMNDIDAANQRTFENPVTKEKVLQKADFVASPKTDEISTIE